MRCNPDLVTEQELLDMSRFLRDAEADIPRRRAASQLGLDFRNLPRPGEPDHAGVQSEQD